MNATFRKLAVGAVLSIGAASAAQAANWYTTEPYGSTFDVRLHLLQRRMGQWRRPADPLGQLAI